MTEYVKKAESAVDTDPNETVAKDTVTEVAEEKAVELTEIIPGVLLEKEEITPDGMLILILKAKDGLSHSEGATLLNSMEARQAAYNYRLKHGMQNSCIKNNNLTVGGDGLLRRRIILAPALF
jgi:hypothetical protein